MKAVIMAGGKGTRLRPLTINMPKPMVPLLNKPVMEYAVELLKKHNITDIAVTLQYLPECIKGYFGDGAQFGVSLNYFEETVPLGTAGSVKNAEKILDETFIVISGDGLTDYDLTKAVAFHKEKGGLATLVMAKVANPLEYGVIMCNKNNRIIRFLEKPGWGEVFSDTVNTGIYILEPEVFSHIKKDVFFDFSKDLFPSLLASGIPLYGYVAAGYWSDIGSLDQYRRTHFDFLNGLIDIPVNGQKIGEGIWVGRNTYLDPGASIKERPVFIGDHCSIGPQAKIGPYTVIGNNNQIDSGTSIEHSILWSGSVLGSGVKLSGATVCREVTVKAGAVLNEGSVLGDGSTVGERAVVKSDVKVWPHKVVVDDSTLHTSLIWNKSNRRLLFKGHGIITAANTEMTPEMAAKLAVSFGSVIAAGGAVVVGYDSHRASQVLGKACAAGLSAAGSDVYDAGVSNSSAVRFAVKRLRVSGGLHLRMLKGTETRFVLEFFDKDGIFIHRDLERKMENVYTEGETRRINIFDFGEIRSVPHITASYPKGLLESVNRNTIRGRHFKMTVAFDYFNLNWLINPLLVELGCEISPVKQTDCRPSDLAQHIRLNQSDLGVILNSNADRITFVSPQGEEVRDDKLLALWAYITAGQDQAGKIAVPVTASSVIERIAGQKGGTVVRTKASPRALMEAYKHEPFQPLFDGTYVLLKVLDYLAAQKTDLGAILKEIPPAFMAEKRVECPLLSKGAVMRRVIEEERDSRIELLEGIKIYRDNGWVLLTPDPEEQSFTVLCDAEAQETAESLAEIYARKVDYIKTVI